MTSWRRRILSLGVAVVAYWATLVVVVAWNGQVDVQAYCWHSTKYLTPIDRGCRHIWAALWLYRYESPYYEDEEYVPPFGWKEELPPLPSELQRAHYVAVDMVHLLPSLFVAIAMFRIVAWCSRRQCLRRSAMQLGASEQSLSVANLERVAESNGRVVITTPCTAGEGGRRAKTSRTSRRFNRALLFASIVFFVGIGILEFKNTLIVNPLGRQYSGYTFVDIALRHVWHAIGLYHDDWSVVPAKSYIPRRVGPLDSSVFPFHVSIAVTIWTLPVLVAALLLYDRWARLSIYATIDRCRNCGYDLTGNVSGRCPECGERVPSGLRRTLQRAESSE